MIISVGKVEELADNHAVFAFLSIHLAAINLVLINHLCGSPSLGYIKETSSLFRIKKRAMISMIWMLIQSQETVIPTTGLYLINCPLHVVCSYYVLYLFWFMLFYDCSCNVLF